MRSIAHCINMIGLMYRIWKMCRLADGYVVESKKKTVPVSYMITLTDEGKEQEANV